jgi:hypothetical protein
MIQIQIQIVIPTLYKSSFSSTEGLEVAGNMNNHKRWGACATTTKGRAPLSKIANTFRCLNFEFAQWTLNV